MEKTFSISVPSETRMLSPKKDGKAEVACTVTNHKPNAARARVQIIAQGGAKSEWFDVRGNPECDFGAQESQQFVILVALPPATPAGTYDFRIDAVNVANPQEDFAQGETVALQWQPPAPEKEPLPAWLIPAIIAAICLVIGIGLSILFLRPPSNTPPTSKDVVVSSSDRRMHQFSLADFPFSDSNGADELKLIQIQGEPTDGQLVLSHVPVTFNEEIKAADIAAGKLTGHIPATNSLKLPLKFKFKVSDGQAYSAEPSTMTVEFASSAFVGNWDLRDPDNPIRKIRLEIRRDAGQLIVKMASKNEETKEETKETFSTPIGDAEDGELSIRQVKGPRIAIYHFKFVPKERGLVVTAEAGDEKTIGRISTATNFIGNFVLVE